jgi:hypothetical protein
MVNLHTDRSRENSGQRGLLDLCKSKPTAYLGLEAVPNGLRSNNGLKHRCWACSCQLRLLLPSYSPLVLPGWLVEPSAYLVLPIRVEVPIRQHVIVLDHLFLHHQF